MKVAVARTAGSPNLNKLIEVTGGNCDVMASNKASSRTAGMPETGVGGGGGGGGGGK